MSDDGFGMTAEAMVQRMQSLDTQPRIPQFDLGRWPPGSNLVEGLHPMGIYAVYTNGFLSQHEFPAQCAKYDILPTAKPTGLFNTLASAPSMDSALNASVKSDPGYKQWT